MKKVKSEFHYLKSLFDKYTQPPASPAKGVIAVTTSNHNLKP
jgi:hypothetical protein